MIHYSQIVSTNCETTFVICRINCYICTIIAEYAMIQMAFRAVVDIVNQLNIFCL